MRQAQGNRLPDGTLWCVARRADLARPHYGGRVDDRRAAAAACDGSCLLPRLPPPMLV